MLNLVSNSLKFTQNGYIHLRCFTNHQDLVMVTVSDSGYGISESDKKKLFKPFGLGLDNKSKNIHGSGLGLNISKKIINRLGGDITVESEVNLGTTMKFNFKPLSIEKQRREDNTDLNPEEENSTAIA